MGYLSVKASPEFWPVALGLGVWTVVTYLLSSNILQII